MPKLLRFGGVGLLATGFYALLAFVFAVLDLGPTPASVAAYLLAAAFSFTAHKRFTFNSPASPARELPRFALINGLGLLLATAAPLVLTERLGLPSVTAVLVTCIGVPAISFLGLDRFVFRPARLEPGPVRP